MSFFNNNSLPLIRLAHPLAFAAFLKHVGAPAESYFRRQGLPTLCTDPSAFVPLNKAWAFFDDIAQREDLAVGWHVGRYIGDNNLNAGLLAKLEAAPTLYQALHLMARMINTESSHLRLGIKEEDHRILFYTTGYTKIRDEPGYSSSQAYQLEAYVDLIRNFIGKHWIPKEIGVTAATLPAVAKEHFPGCRFLLNQQYSYVAVPRSCLHLSVYTRHVKSSDATPMVFTDQLSFAESLSLVLKPYLAEGYPSLNFVASLTGISIRTLARRLSECGKDYQSLVDETRFNVARDLLRDNNVPIRAVAESTGFTDPANFSRMFRRIGGLSPRDFRKAAQSQSCLQQFDGEL